MNKKIISKKIQKKEEYFIQFTDEELATLNISAGDKFSWEEHPEGGFLLKKFETIDIDLEEMPREVLEFLIAESIERDITINDIINEIIEKIIDEERNLD